MGLIRHMEYDRFTRIFHGSQLGLKHSPSADEIVQRFKWAYDRCEELLEQENEDEDKTAAIQYKLALCLFVNCQDFFNYVDDGSLKWVQHLISPFKFDSDVFTKALCRLNLLSFLPKLITDVGDRREIRFNLLRVLASADEKILDEIKDYQLLPLAITIAFLVVSRNDRSDESFFKFLDKWLHHCLSSIEDEKDPLSLLLLLLHAVLEPSRDFLKCCGPQSSSENEFGAERSAEGGEARSLATIAFAVMQKIQPILSPIIDDFQSHLQSPDAETKDLYQNDELNFWPEGKIARPLNVMYWRMDRAFTIVNLVEASDTFRPYLRCKQFMGISSIALKYEKQSEFDLRFLSSEELLALLQNIIHSEEKEEWKLQLALKEIFLGKHKWFTVKQSKFFKLVSEHPEHFCSHIENLHSFVSASKLTSAKDAFLEVFHLCSIEACREVLSLHLSSHDLENDEMKSKDFDNQLRQFTNKLTSFQEETEIETEKALLALAIQSPLRVLESLITEASKSKPQALTVASLLLKLPFIKNQRLLTELFFTAFVNLEDNEEGLLNTIELLKILVGSEPIKEKWQEVKFAQDLMFTSTSLLLATKVVILDQVLCVEGASPRDFSSDQGGILYIASDLNTFQLNLAKRMVEGANFVKQREMTINLLRRMAAVSTGVAVHIRKHASSTSSLSNELLSLPFDEEWRPKSEIFEYSPIILSRLLPSLLPSQWPQLLCSSGDKGELEGKAIIKRVRIVTKALLLWLNCCSANQTSIAYTTSFLLRNFAAAMSKLLNTSIKFRCEEWLLVLQEVFQLLHVANQQYQGDSLYPFMRALIKAFFDFIKSNHGEESVQREDLLKECLALLSFADFEDKQMVTAMLCEAVLDTH